MTKKEEISVFGLIIIFGLAFWVAFYPGFMSNDSIVQFGMSKSLNFSDWHPPIMSWIWSVVGLFFPGPSGMLALHIVLVWTSVYMWWISYKERSFSWLLLAIPFLPWILNFAGVLWKDVGLAFSLFALSGLALRAPTPKKIFLAFILVFYSVNLRHNAIFAVLPILFFLSLRWLHDSSRLKAMIFSFVTIFVCMYLGGVFNYKFLQAEKTKPSNYMMVDDLTYLSVKNNKSFLPGISIDEVKECAAFEIGQNKLLGKVFCLSTQASYKQAAPLSSELKTIWLEKIIQNPVDYLRFRLAAFSYLLRKPSDFPFYIWHPGIDKNPYGIKHVPNGLTLVAERFVKSSVTVVPFFFKPYWWLLSSLLLFSLTFVFVVNKTVVAVRFLLLSSIFYIAGYVPATPMADFRYIYWSVIAITVSFVVLFVDWPGFRSGTSKNRVIAVSVFALFSCFIIFNHGRLAEISMDHAVYNSLGGERVGVEDPVVKNDLVKGERGYEVKGGDPFFIYDVSSLGLIPRDTRWLKFEFTCSGMTVAPELQLFWWGDHQAGASEAQSTTRALVEGVNLMPLKIYLRYLRSTELSRLRGIRLDLANPSACKEVVFEKIEFIK